MPITTFTTLPPFLADPESPSVKSTRSFDSPFPPLNPSARTRGVYERAGFEVNRGGHRSRRPTRKDQDLQSQFHDSDSSAPPTPIDGPLVSGIKYNPTYKSSPRSPQLPSFTEPFAPLTPSTPSTPSSPAISISRNDFTHPGVSSGLRFATNASPSSSSLVDYSQPRPGGPVPTTNLGLHIDTSLANKNPPTQYEKVDIKDLDSQQFTPSTLTAPLTSLTETPKSATNQNFKKGSKSKFSFKFSLGKKRESKTSSSQIETTNKRNMEGTDLKQQSFAQSVPEVTQQPQNQLQEGSKDVWLGHDDNIDYKPPQIQKEPTLSPISSTSEDINIISNQINDLNLTTLETYNPRDLDLDLDLDHEEDFKFKPELNEDDSIGPLHLKKELHSSNKRMSILSDASSVYSNSRTNSPTSNLNTTTNDYNNNNNDYNNNNYNNNNNNNNNNSNNNQMFGIFESQNNNDCTNLNHLKKITSPQSSSSSDSKSDIDADDSEITDYETSRHNSAKSQFSQHSPQDLNKNLPSINEKSEKLDENKKLTKHVRIDEEGICRGCGKPINGKSVWSRDGTMTGKWHRKCFCCTFENCNHHFPPKAEFYIFENLPYCQYHYHVLNNSICTICDLPIEGTCLENGQNERFHINCLKCNRCGEKVDGDYYVLEGEVLCEMHGLKEIELEKSRLFEMNNNLTEDEKKFAIDNGYDSLSADTSFAEMSNNRMSKVERRKTRVLFMS